jgi:hypothetical protein
MPKLVRNQGGPVWANFKLGPFWAIFNSGHVLQKITKVANFLTEKGKYKNLTIF